MTVVSVTTVSFKPKSMLSVLPLSNAIIIDQTPSGALTERKPTLISLHGCPPLLPTATSQANAAELTSLPKVLVSWSSRDILLTSTSTSSARLPDLQGLSFLDLCESRILGVENRGHPCRESGASRSMNGPEKPTIVATANGGMGVEGRAWLSDVTTVVTAAAANNNNNVSNPHHAASSPSITGQRLHEAPALLPTPGSLFHPPISLSSSPDYSSSSQSHLYSQCSATRDSPSYYPPPSGNHRQQLFGATHVLPSPGAYSYYPLQFSQRTYAAPTPASMMARPFPQMESYANSSIMGTMGSHPRSAFLPSQYSASLNPLSTSPIQTSFSIMPRALNPPVSFTQPGHVQFSTSVNPEMHSPNKDGRQRTSSSTSLSPLGNRHLSSKNSSSSSSPIASTTAGCLQQKTILVDNKTAQPKDLSQHSHDPSVREHVSYRLPSGKEGSLKHRILTRPPDIHIEHSALLAERSPDVCSSPKHSKSMTISPMVTSASMPTTPVRASTTSVWRGSPPLPMSSCNPLCYPQHFVKGSIIQLANGEFRSVEELRTEDFVQSAEMSADLKINSSTVVRIEEHADSKTCTLSFSVGEQRVQVNVEAALEHPFFVFGQGWKSCLPDRTQQRYNLQCKKLQVGDVCISLTLRDQPSMRSAALTSCGSVTSLPMDVSGRLLSISRRAEFLAPGAMATTPLTHNIETQTPAGNTMPLPQATLPSGLQSTSLGQPCALRKRRWSAPDKMSEESKMRTKLS